MQWSAVQRAQMEVDDQGSLKLSIPQDVFRTQVMVENAEIADLLHRPRNRSLYGLIQSSMAHALAIQTHKKHMTDPSRAVEEGD